MTAVTVAQITIAPGSDCPDITAIEFVGREQGREIVAHAASRDEVVDFINRLVPASGWGTSFEDVP